LVAIPKESDLYTLFWFRLRRVRRRQYLLRCTPEWTNPVG